jgi:tetratricopeptide (TPR) repeat protein
MKNKTAMAFSVLSVVFSLACQTLTPKMSLEERIAKSTELTNNGDIYYYNNSDYINAKTAYLKAIEYYDQNTRAYVGLANVYDTTGDFDSALGYYNKSLEIDPKFGYGYFHRGIAYKNNSQYANAISDFNLAIENNYENDQIYYLRGVAYDQIGEYQDAYQDYKYFLDLDIGDNANTRFACGRVNTLSLQNSQGFLQFFVNLLFEPCPRFTETYETQDYSGYEDEEYDPGYDSGNWQRQYYNPGTGSWSGNYCVGCETREEYYP